MRRLFVGILILAMMFTTEAMAKRGKSKACKARYVVLIGSDGFSSAVVRAHPGAFPNIEKLMREGSYTLERRSVLPSSSAVNWASMLMGAGPELHAVFIGNSRATLSFVLLNRNGLMRRFSNSCFP